MSRVQNVVRLKFRENVDFPGINDDARGGISDIFPARSSSDIKADNFRVTFEDGWMVIRNRRYGTALRYPATMVQSAIFEQDAQPKET